MVGWADVRPRTWYGTGTEVAGSYRYLTVPEVPEQVEYRTGSATGTQR